MYTPLRFMEQLENIIAVPGISDKQREMFNTITRKWAISAFNSVGLNELMCACVTTWFKGLGNDPLFYACGDDATDENIKEREQVMLDTMNEMLFKFQRVIGLSVSVQDLAEIMLYSDLYYYWTQNKRVYAVDRNLAIELRDTELPKKIDFDCLKKYPCNRFYIDYGTQGAPFAKELVGTFAQLSYSEETQHAVWYFTHTAIGSNKVGCVHTMFEFNGDTIEEFLHVAITMGAEETVVHLDDSACTTFSFREHDFLNFFINFLIYITARNADIEYSERTRQIYKPRKKGAIPKNKMSEIEEYSVGIKIGATIHKERVKVRKAVGLNEDEEEHIPRDYSSHWRSAHWHRYHVKDEDGTDKIVWRWIPMVYVHGNKENNDVHVIRVAK